MNRSSFKWLIVIFSLALSALIVLQIAWLSASFKKERDNWSRMIQEAVKLTEIRIGSGFKSGISVSKIRPGSGGAVKSSPIISGGVNHTEPQIVAYRNGTGDSTISFNPQINVYSGDQKVIDSVMAQVLNEMNLNVKYQLEPDSVKPSSGGLQFVLGIPDSSEESGKREVIIGFEENAKTIFKRLGWVIGGNILLLFFVSAVLIYTLIMVYRQKAIYQMRKEFINNLTHDFKTPVANVSLALEGLLQFDFRNNPDKSVEYMKIAQVENKRLRLMIEKILNLAAFEKGKIEFAKSPVDVNSAIRETIAVFEVQVKHRDGSLTCNLEAERYMVLGDKDHLAQVFFNLLDNANKYSPDVPVIEVSTRTISNENSIEIYVSDQGIGMSPDQQKDIFDNFTRVQEDSSTHVKGFGLGLYYSKMIIQMHGGDIKVSGSPAKGSLFTIRLPLYE